MKGCLSTQITCRRNQSSESISSNELFNSMYIQVLHLCNLHIKVHAGRNDRTIIKYNLRSANAPVLSAVVGSAFEHAEAEKSDGRTDAEWSNEAQ